MSVKVQEAFCFDSFQDRLLFWDDFAGDQLQDEWFESGTGSAAVVDQQTGGIVRLTTGVIDGNAYRIDWQDIRSLLVSKKVSMEFRLKLVQTANFDGFFSLYDDANDFIRFNVDDAVANWRIQSRLAGGAIDTAVTGNVKDTSYHIFRIECFPTGEIHFYIDGTEVTNSPLTTAIPTDYLQPFFQIITREAVAKSVDIDYCYVRQDR